MLRLTRLTRSDRFVLLHRLFLLHRWGRGVRLPLLLRLFLLHPVLLLPLLHRFCRWDHSVRLPLMLLWDRLLRHRRLDRLPRLIR